MLQLLLVAMLLAQGCAASAPKIAFGIKTCRFYHADRAVPQYEAWAKHVPNLLYATDGEPETLPAGAQHLIIEDRRSEPYVPPWDPRFSGTLEQITPSTLPQLTRRVAALWVGLYDRFASDVDWFVVTDDDSFFRLDALMTFLAKHDPEVPAMLGHPVSSERFLLPEAAAGHLRSAVHCGGGSGVVLSRAALELMRSRLVNCMRTPLTTLWDYWDEVQMGVCASILANLKCTTGSKIQLLPATALLPSPPPPPIYSSLSTVASQFWLMNLRHPALQYAQPFIGGLSHPEDWDRLEAFVQGALSADWNKLSAVSFHSVRGARQKFLADRFGGSRSQAPVGYHDVRQFGVFL